MRGLPSALVDVGRVHRGGPHLYEHLVVTRSRFLQVLEPKCVPGPVLVADCRLHLCTVLPAAWPAPWQNEGLPGGIERTPKVDWSPTMQDKTKQLWARQDQHPGDRLRLFSALAGILDASTVLYPGSYVDIAPSFVFDAVTYVDLDRRAARFFSDASGVDEIIRANRDKGGKAEWRFIHADYATDLDLPDGGFDLLVSLYAGFISEHCTRHLRPGGYLLVNPSHGDVAMASIDSRYRLAAVVQSRSGGYHVSDRALETYLRPIKAIEITKKLLHETGRGIGYTKRPFAYLFRRVD